MGTAKASGSMRRVALLFLLACTSKNMPPEALPPILPPKSLFQRANSYAGIGSRHTPPHALILIARIAEMLADHGAVLRSGGAPGADTAFETGCDHQRGKKEIYLPWRGFNGNPSPLHHPPAAAADIAALVHPNWKVCKPSARKFHARNVQQVLGLDFNTPVAFVLFWAPEENGIVTGGTATAVHLAREMKIPTFNLRDEPTANRWTCMVESYPWRRSSFWSQLFPWFRN